MQKIVCKASKSFRRGAWVSKLSSRLSFCYRVPVVEKYLELCLLSYVKLLSLKERQGTKLCFSKNFKIFLFPEPDLLQQKRSYRNFFGRFPDDNAKKMNNSTRTNYLKNSGYRRSNLLPFLKNSKTTFQKYESSFKGRQISQEQKDWHEFWLATYIVLTWKEYCNLYFWVIQKSFS